MMEPDWTWIAQQISGAIMDGLAKHSDLDRRDRLDRMVAALAGGYYANPTDGWDQSPEETVMFAARYLAAIDAHLEEKTDE